MRTARTFLALTFITALLIGLFVAPTAKAAPTNPGITNLIAWWSMDESSGTRYDSHTNDLDLTDNNTVSYVTGKQSNAADFIKTNSEYLSSASSSALQMGTSDVYFGFWFKPDNDSSFQYLLVKYPEYGIAQNAFKILFIVYDTNGDNTLLYNDTTLSPGSWYFVETWTDKANSLIYVSINNGTPASTSANRNGASTGAVDLGGTVGGYSLGAIDEFNFYKRMLTADERTWLYNSGAGRTYSEVNPPATSTPTNTATHTATATATHTATATDTPTSTATHTATTTETYTPTATDTSIPTDTRTPTASTPGMPTLSWNGEITYGEFSTTISNALLCMIVLLIGIAVLVVFILQRKKNVK